MLSIHENLNLTSFEYLKSCALTEKQLEEVLYNKDINPLINNYVLCVQDVDNLLDFKFYRILDIDNRIAGYGIFDFGCAFFVPMKSTSSNWMQVKWGSKFVFYDRFLFDYVINRIFNDNSMMGVAQVVEEPITCGYIIPFSKLVGNLPFPGMDSLFINAEILKEKFLSNTSKSLPDGVDPYLNCR